MTVRCHTGNSPTVVEDSCGRSGTLRAVIATELTGLLLLYYVEVERCDQFFSSVGQRTGKIRVRWVDSSRINNSNRTLCTASPSGKLDCTQNIPRIITIN